MIRSIADYLAFRLEMWRLRDAPFTAADYARGCEETRGKFPNDREEQRSEAVAELFMRGVLGKRLHDA